MAAEDRPLVDSNATGAPGPLPGKQGARGREAHEREAALARGAMSTPKTSLCAPELPDLRPELIYTLVAENVREYAIFLMDSEGIITCWGESARLMKWWTKQEAEGSHLRMLYMDGGSEDGAAEAHLEEAARSGEYSGEGHRVRSDGSTFWAYVTLTALRNEEGRLVGYTKVTRDFTARRAVEAALKRQRPVSPDAQIVLDEANRLKARLMALSHELRTPLNAIVGSIQLLVRHAITEQQPHIDRLNRNSRHLISMVDDALQLFRAEAGHLPYSPEVRRLGPTVDEALADIETQALERKLTLTNAVSGSAADLPYWGDDNHVRQIIVNLLTNAIC